MRANLLERTIRFFSPQRACLRAEYDMRLEVIENMRAFDGAKLGRRTAGWNTPGSSANSEVVPSLPRLRNRSRDLVRNNPYARRGINILVRAMIGTGVKAKFAKKDHASLWEQWCKQCDADGLNDFAGLLDLIERTRRESGECLVRFRTRTLQDGLEVPLQLQVLEPDHLDLNKNESLADGGYILAGIEFDPIGRRRGYWLFRQHPGEVLNTLRTVFSESVFVPAREVIHYFKRDRPSQVRGVPDLATAIIRLRDLDDYEDAELVRKKIEACFSVFVTNSGSGPTSFTQNTDKEQRPSIKMQPGAVIPMNHGDEVSFASPSANGGYTDYIKTVLRAISSALGVTYEQLTGDLSGVNYSSIRAGLLEFRKMIEADQWQTLVPALLEPIMHKWVETADMAGKKVNPAASWTMPKAVSTDPLKEILATKEAIRGGLKTWSEAAREQGDDYEQMMFEFAQDLALQRKHNIYTDTNAAVSEGLIKHALDS